MAGFEVITEAPEIGYSFLSVANRVHRARRSAELLGPLPRFNTPRFRANRRTGMRRTGGATVCGRPAPRQAQRFGPNGGGTRSTSG